MQGQTNHKITDNKIQQKLRNNMTDAEIRLWGRLRGRQLAGCKFRRQHPFLDYVLDFVCLEKRLIVEVDGGQHLESEQDRVRDERLREAGFRVLRFWNNQVLQELEAVAEAIWSALQDAGPPVPHPHPSPPLEGEGAHLLGEQRQVNPHPSPPLEGEGAHLLGEQRQVNPHPIPPLEGEGVAAQSAHAGHPLSPLEGGGAAAQSAHAFQRGCSLPPSRGEPEGGWGGGARHKVTDARFSPSPLAGESRREGGT